MKRAEDSTMTEWDLVLLNEKMEAEECSFGSAVSPEEKGHVADERKTVLTCDPGE